MITEEMQRNKPTVPIKIKFSMFPHTPNNCTSLAKFLSPPNRLPKVNQCGTDSKTQAMSTLLLFMKTASYRAHRQN